VGGDPFYLKFGSTDPRWIEVADFQSIQHVDNLRQEVVIALTMNCFKKLFDRYSANNRYSMERRYGPHENAKETTIQTSVQFVNT